MRYNSGQTSSRLFLMLALTIFASGVLLSWLLMSSSLFKTPQSTPAPVPNQAQPLDIPTVAPAQQDINIALSQPAQPKLTEYGTRGPSTASIESPPESPAESSPLQTVEPKENNENNTAALDNEPQAAAATTTTANEANGTTEIEPQDTNNKTLATTADNKTTETTEAEPQDANNTTLAVTTSDEIANTTEVEPQDANNTTLAATTADETTDTTETEPQDTFDSEQSGWIYAGEYKDTQWLSSNLQIESSQLPQEGEIYPVRWGTNVREAPPSNRINPETGSKLAPTVAHLNTYTPVQVIKVKFSGNSGHIWLNVNY